MSDLKAEREHLFRAERDIAAGERRVSAQVRLVERLRQDGHETGDAEHLLRTFEQTLETWRGHRSLILQAIARLEAKEATG